MISIIQLGLPIFAGAVFLWGSQPYTLALVTLILYGVIDFLLHLGEEGYVGFRSASALGVVFVFLVFRPQNPEGVRWVSLGFSILLILGEILEVFSEGRPKFRGLKDYLMLRSEDDRGD